MLKNNERDEAVNLRKNGLSYREILAKIPIAKSTLSLWLRKVRLSKIQKQRLTLKKLNAAKRGADTQRQKRLNSTRQIRERARTEIKGIGKKTFWLMGIMLYWAEGTKEKEFGSATAVIFSNSDPFMLRFFKRWLIEVCKITENNIIYELYIHESWQDRLNKIKQYWTGFLDIKGKNSIKVYYKRHPLNQNKLKTRRDYFGLIRIRVKKSSALNRKIAGWIEGINHLYCGIGQW